MWAEERGNACEQSGLGYRRLAVGSRCNFGIRAGRGRTRRDHAADRRLFYFDRWLSHLRQLGRLNFGQTLVARFDLIADIGCAQALDFNMRCFELVIGDNDDADIVTRFDLAELAAFFVEQEIGHVGRRLHNHLSGVVLHRVLFDQAQGRQR